MIVPRCNRSAIRFLIIRYSLFILIWNGNLLCLVQMLENYGIAPENAANGHHKVTLKRNVVEMAKEWPLYFARLYPVSVSFFFLSPASSSFFPTNSQQRPVYFSNNYVVSRYTTRRALDNTPTSSSWPFPTLASVWSNASRAAKLNRCTCCSHLGKSNFTFYSKFSPDFGRRLTV